MRGVSIVKGAPLALASLVLAAAALQAPEASAQAPATNAPAQAPQTPKAAAPIDLSGNWVAIVNEDWRWRMVTPPKGDYPGLPLNAAGRAAADAWDPATDGSCKAYGVGGLMRMPTRLRVGWDGDDAIKIETDAGVQTRRLSFAKAAPGGQRTLQGQSTAQWEYPQPAPGARAGDPRPPGGTLKVVTTQATAGWLRKNGVPYSENAVITEYFDRFAAPDGQEWLTVLTIVDDPQYLNTPMLTSSHFRKEADGSKWRPKPCRAD